MVMQRIDSLWMIAAPTAWSVGVVPVGVLVSVWDGDGDVRGRGGAEPGFCEEQDAGHEGRDEVSYLSGAC